VSAASPDPDVRLADRRLIAALRRLHRREPLKPDQRIDAVVDEARADPAERRPAGHRGGGSLRGWSDAGLRARIEWLATDGQMLRDGRRVHLPGHQPVIADPAMRERVNRLMAGLREVGAAVPRVDPLAARLGIPPGVLDQLRAAGELVPLGEGIDYPAGVLTALMDRIDGAARRGPLNVARVRDELHVSRRHAEALLGWRARRGPSRPGHRGRGVARPRRPGA
jgi:hypothetical protein